MLLKLETIEQSGNAAVKRLRQMRLKNGQYFMINSKVLPTNQCYLEYPNGSMKLVTLDKAARDFIVLQELTNNESNSIRSQYHLL